MWRLEGEKKRTRSRNEKISDNDDILEIINVSPDLQSFHFAFTYEKKRVERLPGKGFAREAKTMSGNRMINAFLKLEFCVESQMP